MSSLVIFFCVLLAIPAQLQARDIVATACGKALYKDVCQSSLASAPNKADKKSVCTYALNLVSSTASKITNQIKASKNPAAAKAIADCSTAYGDATDLIKEAQTAAASAQYFEVNSKISGAMNAADTCESGFKETANKSSLTALNTKFTQLCSTVLAVTNA